MFILYNLLVKTNHFFLLSTFLMKERIKCISKQYKPSRAALFLFKRYEHSDTHG